MAIPDFNPVPVRDRRFDPDTMLEAARLSLAEAERYESNAEEQRSRDATNSRTSYEAMRDELLLANAQASIAVSEALSEDKQSDPNEPSKSEVDPAHIQFALQTAIDGIGINLTEALDHLGCRPVSLDRAVDAETLAADLIEWAEGEMRRFGENSVNHTLYAQFARTVEKKVREASGR